MQIWLRFWAAFIERVAWVRASAPLVGIACGVISGALGWAGLTWALLFLVVGLTLVRSDLRWRTALALITILTAWRAQQLEVSFSSATRTSSFVTGELIIGRLTGMGDSERVGFLALTDGGLIKVAVQDAFDYEPGDILLVEGQIFSPAPARNPAEFSLLYHWGQLSIEQGLDLERAGHVGADWRQGIWRFSERAKVGLKKSITRGIEDDEIGTPIIVAMMLGDTPSSTSEITQAFRYSGAMHVFAVSGLHVTIVGGIVWGILFVLRVPRRGAIFLIIIAMASYAMITGGRAPAMRATLMAVTFLSAFLLRRKPFLFNSLALSMIIVLLWRPAQVTEVGFQLSYGVITAIGIGFAIAYQWTGKIAELDPFFPRRLLSSWQKRRLGFRGKIAAMAATSLAAWVGSLPWMAYHFGLITPVAVLASLVLIPFTFLVLSLGLFSFLVGLVSPTASEGINHLNCWAARAAFYSAKGFSAVPLGHQLVGSQEPADWVVFDFSDGGASSFLATGEGTLIDLGSDRRYYQMIRPAMRRWHHTPENFILTHPDAKHTGAILTATEQLDPQHIYLPVKWSRSPSYREFIAQDHPGVVVTETDKRYPLSSEAWFEVLRSGQEDLDTLSDSRGMAIRVHWAGWKILVMGDLGVEEEREMMASGIDLSADLVIIGRHGRTYSGSIEFLKATGTRAVIASSSTYPKRETPTKLWRAAVEKMGMHLLAQDETGAVLIDFDSDKLCLKSYLDPDLLIILENSDAPPG
ncbi:ComEC/Rec2 family competence protein [Akkermansiaceae bacterium]|nr:ComEC/Rec2 family competence protein [Akkermansiaceae bacterium]MDB4412269.1 ComEC/Rec2 family competence protein [Akkermansiaceae bacterium]MDB4456594.1 ComEC/Rec2 family competence protein [bacterium]MDB4585656.1 ComEC/Rec2 family competence protein [Akkermansiaceae bacterium]